MTNLSTANSLYLGSTAVDRVYLGSEKVWPMFSPAEFYADAEAGAWFDIGDPNAMLYGGTGVYPDPASGANVPTVLGKDQGFVEVDQGALGAANLSPTVTQSGNTFTFDNSPAGARSNGGISLVRGRVYKQVVEVIGTGEVVVYLGAYSGTFSAGIHTLLLGSGGGSNYITRAGPAGFNGTVEILSIHEIVGVHAIQDDTSKSPRYEVEPQPGSRTTRYLLRDGVDDSLPAEMPNLGTDATVWYANEHGSYIQSGQTVNGTFETLRGEKTYAVGAIDRALTAEETTDLKKYLDRKRDGYVPDLWVGNSGVQFDFFNMGTLLQNASDPVTSAGQTILIGLDQSGNAIHATEADLPKQPKYQSGPSRAVFDGVDDNLSITVPAGGWRGTMVLATQRGTASYGVDIPAGQHNVVNDNPNAPALDVTGVFIRDGALSEYQSRNVEAYYVSQGATPDFGAETSFRYLYADLSYLTHFPMIDTSSVTSFRGTWKGCNGLLSFPPLDTSKGKDFYHTWHTNTSMIEFSPIDVSSVTILNSTWYNCSSLLSFPMIDTSGIKDFPTTWRSCGSLTSFPALEFSSATRLSGTWLGCSSLADFPAGAFDNTSCANYTDAFEGTNLTEASIDGILVSIVTSGVTGGTFGQSGGAAPSAATGQPAVDTLRQRGWTVTVTGGY